MLVRSCLYVFAKWRWKTYRILLPGFSLRLVGDGALLHNVVASARVGCWDAYLGDHEQAVSCPLSHYQLA